MTISTDTTWTQNYTCDNVIVNNSAVLTFDSVGAGNVNTDMFNAIKYALGKKIPVVITRNMELSFTETKYQII